MAMAAHDPKAAKRVGVPPKVAKHFMKADKGKRFADGGQTNPPPKPKPSDKNFTAEQQRQAANKNELANRPSSAPQKQKPSDADQTMWANMNEAKRPDPNVTHPEQLNLTSQQNYRKGGKVKESKEMAKAEMKALKRGHAPKEVMEHEKSEHKAMGYKKGGHVKHAPKHHEKHMKRGGVSARMKKPAVPPAALAAMLGGAGAGAPPMGGDGAPPAGGSPMGGMAHGGHVHHHHAKVSHHHHHHHYAHGGHVKHKAKGGLSEPTKKGVEAMIGGKSHKGHHGDEAAKKGHTKAKVVKMAHGGHVGSHKHRKADGAAKKGHTKGHVR
jgi:hypothetical protein